MVINKHNLLAAYSITIEILWDMFPFKFIGEKTDVTIEITWKYIEHKRFSNHGFYHWKYMKKIHRTPMIHWLSPRPEVGA